MMRLQTWPQICQTILISLEGVIKNGSPSGLALFNDMPVSREYSLLTVQAIVPDDCICDFLRVWLPRYLNHQNKESFSLNSNLRMVVRT